MSKENKKDKIVEQVAVSLDKPIDFSDARRSAELAYRTIFNITTNQGLQAYRLLGRLPECGVDVQDYFQHNNKGELR